MRIILASTMALALAACGSEKSGTIETEDGETAEYTIDDSSGGVTASIETEDGTATMQTGENVKADLPNGFSVYPGATIQSVTNVAQDGDKGSLVMLESTDSPQKIADHYRKEAEAAGISIEMDLTVNDGKMIGGTGENGMSFSLNATPSEGTTQAQLMVSEGLGN
ncbi:hypothetical protein [Parerythrobacter jejuensis]|uniref:Lipoprotein n=1 Tax=Parerythrobacter jejuensis TaxID=795812 RepID=A0A845B1M5_9SPHN|nr:hypothetical protein [Parerythrobacter jejuensis]MXP32888.1 hypothetical protein [Parerythrobacter jejuensis]